MVIMATAWTLKDDGTTNPLAPDTENQKDLTTQLVLSIALGLSAFLGFCVSHALETPFELSLSLLPSLF